MSSIMAVLVGAVVANFLYENFNDKNWKCAIDRTYFQSVVLGFVALFQWIDNWGAA